MSMFGYQHCCFSEHSVILLMCLTCCCPDSYISLWDICVFVKSFQQNVNAAMHSGGNTFATSHSPVSASERAFPTPSPYWIAAAPCLDCETGSAHSPSVSGENREARERWWCVRRGYIWYFIELAAKRKKIIDITTRGLYLQHNSVFFIFYLQLHFLIKTLDLIIVCCCFPVQRKFRCDSGLCSVCTSQHGWKTTT